MMKEISINRQLTPMNLSHIDAVVAVHLAAFDGFTLSILGEGFLKEFYTGVLDDPTGMAFVILDQQNLVGFVAGSAQPNGFYRRLLYKRWWRFGVAALPAVLSKPRIFPRVLRAFSMPHEPLPHPNCATLMSIAVNPALQGYGAGKGLVKAFLEEAAARGLDSVNLKTDANDNDKVNQFYIKMGFELYRTFTTPEGRLMHEYVYCLDNYQS
jgi:ribosomal protein S18 acetylase RimI-like enzyme